MTDISLHRSRLRAGIALLVIGFSVGGVVARMEGRTTPLPEEIFPELKAILQGALQQSPQMIHKNIELAQMEANRMSMAAQRLPNVGSGVSYNVSQASVSANTSVSSRSSGLFYSLSVSQTLYRWGTVQAQVDAASIQLNIAKRNYTEAYRLLAGSIRTQYLGLVAKKITWRNAQAARDRSAYSLSLEEAKLQYGRISPGELIIPRLDLEEATLRADRTAEDFAQSKRVFARLTGLPELSDASVPEQIPAVKFDPAEATGMARHFASKGWENFPSVITARDWVRMAELNYKSAKYRLYPMFSFGAGISQVNSTSASENTVAQVGVLSKSAGISASWSLFDGGATKAAKISAQANIRYYERILQTQTDTVLDQVRAQEKQLGFSHRAMVLAETRKDLADDALRLRQDEVKQGLAAQSSLDALQGAQDAYQYLLVSQRLDFLSRWADFVSTVDVDPALQLLPANLKSNVR